MTANEQDGAAMRPPHLHVWTAFGIAVILLVGVLCGGCSSDDAAATTGEPTPPSLDPVVWGEGRNAGRGEQDNTKDERELADDVAGWKEKLALAQQYAAGGYDEQALQILDGALARKPPSAWAEKMRALKSSLRVRRAEEALLRVEARATRDYVAFGQPIDFIVRLRNVSAETITILPPGDGEHAGSPSALMLEITRLDRDIHATELRRTWNQTVYIQQVGDDPIRIPAGGLHEIPVRVPADAAGPALAGLRTIEVSGTLRPTQLRKGTSARTVRLPIRRGRVMALPRNFEPLTVDPLKSMRTALTTGAPAHLLIATEFVPTRRQPEAVEILARALDRGHPSLYRAALGGLGLVREHAAGQPVGPLVKPLIDALGASPRRPEALMEGLSTLTGVRLAPDPRLWRDWWRREANRRKAVTAVRPSGST